MILARGKKNRRRKAPATRGRLLRNLPRPRLPRGRGAAVLGLVLAAAAGCGWLVYKAYAAGTLLTVARVEVSGNLHWGASRLLERAGLDIGRRLHEVPFQEARRRLLALPGVEAASVRYLPGGTLRVSVREAEVVAMRPSGSGWRGLTPAGEWMPLTARAPEDVPVLEMRGLDREGARRVAAWLANVRARYPDVFAGFSQVSPRGGHGEADVYWRDGLVRLRVDTDSLNGTFAHLTELMRREQGDWVEGATVDLRIEGYAYVF